MSAQLMTHLAAAAGAATLGVVVMARSKRSRLQGSMFFTALSIACWSVSQGFLITTDQIFWRVLSPALSPLPFAAYLGLSLRASLRNRKLVFALETMGLGGAAMFSALILAGLVYQPLLNFVLSPHWNMAFAAFAAPYIVLSVAVLTRSLRAETGEHRQLCAALLVAGAIGFVGGFSEVLPPGQPLQFGALCLLIALAIAAVGVVTRHQAEEAIALKRVLASVGLVAGILVAASYAAWRTQSQPLLAAIVLAAIGLTGFAAYHYAAGRWRKQLAEAARLSALGKATSVLAHEVRNPLTTVQGVVDILDEELKRGGDLSRAPQYFATVRSELQRVLELVEDCLTYSRSPRLVRERFDLRKLVERVVQAGQLRFPRAQLEYTQPQQEIVVLGDAGQLTRLVENLVVNACQTGETPQVKIVTAVKDRLAYIEVTDDGPGVSEQLAEQVFEPFFTTKDRGGGLGLAIVREIARRHGGDIKVSTAVPSGGAHFVAWFELDTADSIT